MYLPYIVAEWRRIHVFPLFMDVVIVLVFIEISSFDIP